MTLRKANYRFQPNEKMGTAQTNCAIPILFWASQRHHVSVFVFAAEEDGTAGLAPAGLLAASTFFVSADADALVLSRAGLFPPSVEVGLFSLLAESDLLSLAGAADLLSSVADSALRLSLMYHPDPLKIIPVDEKSFRTAF